MSDDGSVVRSVVIDVLRRNGSEVSSQPGQPNMFFVVKGETFEIIAIPEVCGRKLVRYLSRKFTTHIHYFYNPLMLPAKPEEPVQ
ncbi:MAG: hypothetical protein WAL32_17210 [Terriglobales bacterium]